MNITQLDHKAILDNTKSWMFTTSGQLFTLITLIPTVITALYLYFIAPDRYVSIAHLSIYDSSAVQASNDLFSSLGLGNSQTNSDLQLLQAYLQSPTLLKIADEALGVKSHFANESDFIFGINEEVVFEDFHDFYLKRSYAEIDATSGLLTLTTEGYTPDFSLILNQFLVTEGERIINQLNQNVARTEMNFAEQEIARSLEILRNDQQVLTNFQNEKNITSPESEGESIITIIYNLEASLAEAKAQLSETLTFLSEDSPQAKSLAAKISAIENQINEQKIRITSQGDDEALNQLGVEYSELLFRVELAQVVHQTAINSYELSRNQASKQLKHLLVPSPPVLPEKASLPDRGYWLITFTLIYLCLFGIARMILRSIQEHMD